MTVSTIFKIVSTHEWALAEAEGRFIGSSVDIDDGFIHFSTATQAAETARRHFAGRKNLLLVAIDVASLASALKWEPSRGGDLFPHLYDTLDLAAVRQIWPLPLDADGQHIFPENLS